VAGVGKGFLHEVADWSGGRGLCVPQQGHCMNV